MGRPISMMGPVGYWSRLRTRSKVSLKVSLIVLSILLAVVLLWARFGFTPVVIAVAFLAAVVLAVRKWRARTPDRIGWIWLVAFAMVALLGLLSYTPANPLNRLASPGRHFANPARTPVVPSITSGNLVSKVVIDGNPYSATNGKLEMTPLVQVPRDVPHKVNASVQVFVTSPEGKPRRDVVVSVNGESGKTGADGSFTAQKVVFENKASVISGRSDLLIKLGSGQPIPIEVWAVNLRDGGIGQPALTKEQAIAMLNNPQFVSSLRTMCPGVGPADITGVEQTRSVGQGMIAVGQNGQLVNSTDQIPAGQPVWSFTLAAGKSCSGQPNGSVVVNPVCQNITGKVPQNAPPAPAVPTAPPSGPSPVLIPVPTPVSTPLPIPTKNPANAPLPPPPPSPGATPVPPSTPQPGSGSGTVTVRSTGCGSSGCSVSWSDSNTATNVAWVTCNGDIHWGSGSGGLFSTSFKLSPGLNYPCRANSKVSGSSVTDSSTLFYLTP